MYKSSLAFNEFSLHNITRICQYFGGHLTHIFSSYLHSPLQPPAGLESQVIQQLDFIRSLFLINNNNNLASPLLLMKVVFTAACLQRVREQCLLPALQVGPPFPLQNLHLNSDLLNFYEQVVDDSLSWLLNLEIFSNPQDFSRTLPTSPFPQLLQDIFEVAQPRCTKIIDTINNYFTALQPPDALQDLRNNIPLIHSNLDSVGAWLNGRNDIYPANVPILPVIASILKIVNLRFLWKNIDYYRIEKALNDIQARIPHPATMPQ